MAKQGKTTGNLKMRSGPGMQFDPPIAYLVPDTALEILGEEGDWWKVRAGGKEGYVGKKYVAVTETPAAADPPPAEAEGAKQTLTAGKGGRGPTPSARPVGRPGPAKGITPDASTIDAGRAPKAPSKPSAKPSSVRPPQPKPGLPKSKGPSGGIKKK
jgi:hypothetical protein